MTIVGGGATSASRWPIVTLEEQHGPAGRSRRASGTGADGSRGRCRARLLRGLARDRSQALEPASRELTDDRSLGDGELERSDANFGRMLDDLLERIAFQERLHDRQPMPRLARRQTPILDGTRVPVQAADRLGAVTWQEHESIPVDAGAGPL